MLGMLYTQGIGVGRDYAEAVRWCEKAAAAGLRAAQFSLGWPYYQGGEAAAGHPPCGSWHQLNGDPRERRRRERLSWPRTHRRLRA